MINERFRREKADVDSLTDEGKRIYEWFRSNCPTDANKCDPAPYDKAIRSCQSAPAYGMIAGRKRDTSGRAKSVKMLVKKHFENIARKQRQAKVPSCYQSSNLVPFIVGGVVGVIVLLAIAIGIFCYCKKEKSARKGQSMTGTTVGGTTATGTTNAETTTAAPTARY
ncbi:unnamed protein product [Caenorhabditis nigoni]